MIRAMKYAIVEAPSALGHVPEHRGVERAREVLLGAGLADGRGARRAGGGAVGGRGRCRLLYIDADPALYQPEVKPLGGPASASDLAFATGYGPDVVTDI